MTPVRAKDDLILREVGFEIAINTPTSQLLYGRHPLAVFAPTEDDTEFRRGDDQLFTRLRFPLLEIRFVGHRGLDAGFANDFVWVFVVTHGDELYMPNVVRTRPLKEFESSDQFRSDPDAFLHLSRRKPLSPSPTLILRQVSEWTGGGDERLEELVYVPS